MSHNHDQLLAFRIDADATERGFYKPVSAAVRNFARYMTDRENFQITVRNRLIEEYHAKTGFRMWWYNHSTERPIHTYIGRSMHSFFGVATDLRDRFDMDDEQASALVDGDRFDSRWAAKRSLELKLNRYTNMDNDVRACTSIYLTNQEAAFINRYVDFKSPESLLSFDGQSVNRSVRDVLKSLPRDA